MFTDSLQAMLVDDDYDLYVDSHPQEVHRSMHTNHNNMFAVIEGVNLDSKGSINCYILFLNYV